MSYTCPFNYPGCPPDPYHLPGYMGFVPSMKMRYGKTFGQHSNDIYQDPCEAHSPAPLIEPNGCMKFYPCDEICCPSEGIGSPPHCKPPRRMPLWVNGCPSLPECRPRIVPGPCGPCGDPSLVVCPPDPSPNYPGICNTCPSNAPPDPKAHHLNRSPYNCPCKRKPDTSVYRCCEGVSPTYAGHIPGFTFHSNGKTLGKATFGTKQYMQDCFYYNTFSQT